MEDKKKYYKFNKIMDRPYRIEYIYPIKQRDVSYIVDNMPLEVRRMYVFGSSLTLDCGLESDIDILVIANKTDELYKAFSCIFKSINSEVDIIIKSEQEFEENLEDETSICSEVSRKGLLIYERAI